MRQLNLHILVIEDNPGDYILVNEYLEESFPNAVVFHADTLAGGIEFLEKEKIDVTLLDLTLPDGMGIESFNTINAKAPGVPVIILTGLGDTQLALESLQVGAQDYIVKDDLSPQVLAKSIRYGIERSKTRERLKKSEEQYKFLFDHNPLPMCAYHNTTHRFLKVNEAALAHYGYTEEEFLQLTIENLEQDYSEGDQKLQHTNNKGVTIAEHSVDYKHRKKNGDIIDVEIRSHEIVIEDQKACLAVFHDVTERNKAKEQLRESEQMFRTISENFPNGAVAIFKQGPYHFVYSRKRVSHTRGRCVLF